MSKYRKIRFISKLHGATAAMVITEDKYREIGLSGFSRLFPVSECLKMEALEFSPAFESWDGAFDFSFDTDTISHRQAV